MLSRPPFRWNFMLLQQGVCTRDCKWMRIKSNTKVRGTIGSACLSLSGHVCICVKIFVSWCHCHHCHIIALLIGTENFRAFQPHAHGVISIAIHKWSSCDRRSPNSIHFVRGCRSEEWARWFDWGYVGERHRSDEESPANGWARLTRIGITSHGPGNGLFLCRPWRKLGLKKMMTSWLVQTLHAEMADGELAAAGMCDGGSADFASGTLFPLLNGWGNYF